MRKKPSLSLADRLYARRMGLPQPRPWRMETLQIPMRDGVRLGADLYTPAGPAKGLLLYRGPYGRGFMMALGFARAFAAQGYAVLFVSTRGTADSEGVMDPMRDEAADGQDVVTWMRSQSWYPGRFATIGGSYLGYTQWALLSDPPDDLAASIVTMGPHDFSRHFWGSGSFNFDLFGWSAQVAEAGGNTSVLRSMLSQASFGKRVAPVIHSTPVLPAAARFFSSLNKEWVLERLVRPELDDPFWAPMQHADALERTTTPTLILAGWQDIFLPQSIHQYTRLRERGVDVALTVGAWTHIQLLFGAQAVMGPQSLDWLDAHLAAAQPLQRRTPVHIQVTGRDTDTWRHLGEWPPSGATTSTLYLQPGGTLSESRPDSEATDRTFLYDPAQPTPAIGGNIIAGGGYRDDSAYANRSDVATYDSEPLPHDVTIMGAPRLALAHSTELPDADLFVRISDVDPTGRTRNVTESYRRVARATTVELDLFDAAHTFRTGHRIRLIIAGGSFAQFTRNPGTGENPLTATELKPNRHTISHVNGASSLRLPIHDDQFM